MSVTGGALFNVPQLAPDWVQIGAVWVQKSPSLSAGAGGVSGDVSWSALGCSRRRRCEDLGCWR
jgi:hypothetical protein